MSDPDWSMFAKSWPMLATATEFKPRLRQLGATASHKHAPEQDRKPPEAATSQLANNASPLSVADSASVPFDPHLHLVSITSLEEP